MSKVRYNKTFKGGIVTILFCCLLFGFVFTMSIISMIQYNDVTKDMLTTKATIIDIKIDHHSSKYGSYDQEMQIVYVVDGKIYSRELATDTPVAFEAGYRTLFSVGDTVVIYYSPENPMKIATSLSMDHAVGMMIFSGVSLAFMVAILITVIITRKRFIITEQEYNKEKRIRKAKREIYKNTKGYKIRVQFFNLFLFFEFCGFVLVITMLLLNTLLNGVGTKLESFAEVISMFFVFAGLTSPIWILSLINRRFFGKIVCILTDEGIKYDEKTIRWDDINEIVYEVNPALSVGSSMRGNCSHARVIGDGFEIEIKKAPLMILKKSKKYKKEMRAYLSKRSFFTLTAIPFASIAVISVLFALALML